ncbi:Arginine--tRNA ligase [Trichinella spiralis]|uniref:Arginine--tRNA ligase n=1 Tax=Trichinella spiralis TaxID=6334 RepID=A0ABR3K6J0_TRISP
MLHGRLTFMHLAAADTIVGDNSRACSDWCLEFMQRLPAWHHLAKQPFQLLWRIGLSSDDPLSAEIRTWRQSRDHLTLAQVEILRVIIPQQMSLYIHAFGDGFLRFQAMILIFIASPNIVFPY